MRRSLPGGRMPSNVVERTVAGAAMLLPSPLLCLIGVAIKLGSPRPVLHRARRTGRGGSTFVIFKFRTMVQGADTMRPGVTGADDPRVTRVGYLLRKTKLDELPQVVNVLQGDMSFVGPGPEDPRHVGYYSRDQLRLLDVRPGITSPASLGFIAEESLLTGDDWERIYVQTMAGVVWPVIRSTWRPCRTSRTTGDRARKASR